MGCFFTPKWNIDFLLGGIHIGKKKTQKNKLFRCVFCAQNDEGENCQQRKVLTSCPIRIAQFHKMSCFKSTKNKIIERFWASTCGRDFY